MYNFALCGLCLNPLTLALSLIKPYVARQVRGADPDLPTQYVLWAETKKGSVEISAMVAQLILNIGKARAFKKIHILPLPFLGCFDFEKIAFVPYNDIQDIFTINDFNWNVTTSNHETGEFSLVRNRIESILTDFLAGKLGEKIKYEQPKFFSENEPSFVPTEPLKFSPEAQAVFDAGREIWRYYYQKTKGQNTASKQPTLYEIKEYFKGRKKEDGKMKNKSASNEFNRLEETLKGKLQILAEKIQPKVYEYEFLLR